jgi:hypothetical protein
MPKKTQVGRPKLPKGAVKETKLQVRLLRSEEKEIEAAAGRAGKTKSQLVRDILLDTVRGTRALSDPALITGIVDSLSKRPVQTRMGR